MKPFGILFDFNGTLVFDEPEHMEAWQIFLDHYFPGQKADADFWRKIQGKTNEYFLPILFGQDLSPQEIHTLSEEKEAIYREICKKHPHEFRLVPGASELFSLLLKRQIPFTIATGANRGNMDFYYSFFHLDQWLPFDQVVYDDGSFPGKPAPDVYLKAAAKIGLAPEHCFVVEDSRAGLMASEAAKIGKTIGIVAQNATNPFKENDPLFALIHDYRTFSKFLPSV